jgi:hypothetical protein
MFSTAFKKILLLMVLAATALVFVLQFIISRTTPAAAAAPTITFKPEFKYHYSARAPKVAAPETARGESETNELGQCKISRDKAEAWLAKHHRNAASLLAVCRALGDTNYLFEAATNFPNDPQVQLAVLSRNAFPEDRRKWLDAFKTSSPSNSLANYLSAADYFKSGNPDEAVQELVAASSKAQFRTYSIETLLDGEELFSDAGKPAPETASLAMAGMMEENLPQLSSYKVVARGVGDLIQQKTQAETRDLTGTLANWVSTSQAKSIPATAASLLSASWSAWLRKKPSFPNWIKTPPTLFWMARRRRRRPNR